MKLFTKTSSLILFLIYFFASATFAFSQQTTDAYEDVFLFAQKLESQGVFDQAELEYKRYIFLQDYSAGIHQTQAFSALAGLYEKNEQWELAAQTIQKAILSAQNQNAATDKFSDSEIDTLKMRHIKYLENAFEEKKNYSLSENLFIFSYINLADFSDDIKQCANLAVIKNQLSGELWSTAENSYDQMEQQFPDFFTDDEKQTIKSQFNLINNFKPKKQMLAGYLSLFPGLGQLYAGDYKDSINAFLLNGSLIAVSVYSICTLDLWTFSLLEFNPLAHFMQGNIYNAQKDAYEYNRRFIDAHKKELLQIFDKVVIIKPLNIH